MSNEVISLFTGQDVQCPTPNETCVAILRDALAQAEAGEIIGVAMAKLHHDHLGSFRVGGQVGGYSMLGALYRVQSEISRILEEADG